MRFVSMLALGLIFTAGQGLAADWANPKKPASVSFVKEFRLGLFDHDRWSPEKGSLDVNAEVLFAKPYRGSTPLWDFLIPNPHVGTTLNTAGRTSHLYAGFTWGTSLPYDFFWEASFGGAVHNGHSGPGAKQNALGCNMLFRESGSIGYKINQSWSVMATVEHLSNAGLCNHNRGLTNMGARLGYSF